MRPLTLTRSGTPGTSSIAILDHYRTPFNVGVGVVITGTVTATLQHTFDDVLTNPATATWFDHVDLKDLIASADGNYAFPVRGVRINMTAGTGTVTATLVQAGMPGQ